MGNKYIPSRNCVQAERRYDLGESDVCKVDCIYSYTEECWIVLTYLSKIYYKNLWS